MCYIIVIFITLVALIPSYEHCILPIALACIFLDRLYTI